VRHFVGTAALVLFCACFSLAGGFVGLRAASPNVRSVTLGTVAFGVSPAREGTVDVYVPLVDWGVRAHPYRAPLAVQLEFRSVERDAALASLRSSGAADANLGLLKAELRKVVRQGLLRAAIVVTAGGLLSGVLAGALVVACGRRRRWLAFGTLTGLATALAATSFFAVGVSRFDYGAFREPTFYAHGAELPKLLSFSEQLLATGDTYTDSYDQAVAGLTNLVAFASNPPRSEPVARSAVLASDLHSNSLVLPAFADYTAGKTVFLVGDFTELGTSYEQGLVGELGTLGGTVVAVSGNHDSRSFMVEAAQAGVVVLTRSGRLLPDGSTDGQPLYRLDGLVVAGYDDPLESIDGSLAERRLELKERRLGAQRDFLAWYAALPQRPDVVLVHQHALAHALLHVVAGRGSPGLLILTGHDHRQHVDREGRSVLVDGGTLGAGGPFGIGEERSGFAELHLAGDGRLAAVDLVEVEPLSGEASARRLVLDEPADPDSQAEAAGP
jgi:Calcineurin-like phosphoesterase superfamily domain